MTATLAAQDHDDADPLPGSTRILPALFPFVKAHANPGCFRPESLNVCGALHAEH
jgi:hypothetical protein